MSTDPVVVGPDATATAAKTLLEADGMHHLPVVDDGKLVGIVSSSDLLKFYLLDDRGASAANVAVRQIMEPDPVVLFADANLRDAAVKLSVGGFHALPIVEADQTLVGIVTSSDLIDYLLKNIPRGDGSLKAPSGDGSSDGLNDDEVSDILRAAKDAVHRGADNKVARLLLKLRQRNQMLHAACHAAELYVRSGQGEHEHSVLVKRLADVRDIDATGRSPG